MPKIPRKVTDTHLATISQMDLEGQKFVDIAKAVGVAESTVRKYVHRLRSERRESRNIQAGHVLDQLDELKRQNWRLARLAADSDDADGRAKAVAHGRIVLDCLKEQSRILGFGADRLKIETDQRPTPHIVMVAVKDREELRRAMTLDEYQSKLVSSPYG